MGSTQQADLTELIQRLFEEKTLPADSLLYMITHRNPEDAQKLFALARIRQQENFGKEVFLRGLIEFTNICRCDCLYCGIRRSNAHAERYRLTREEILACAEAGHRAGFRTFVLQGGEDMYFDDDAVCAIVGSLKERFPDSAVTLSIGERPKESYERYFRSGADRYLLRHETAVPSLYQKLHPSGQTLENRIRCLYDLKEIGFQVGAGMMIGAPYQQPGDLVRDLLFLQELQPEMIGTGPFIPHKDTPFAGFASGSLGLCLFLLGMLRLMFPKALIPATTALGTIEHDGREQGILAGANVIMPNLSPSENREKYLLYDNKIGVQDDSLMAGIILKEKIEAIGYSVNMGRGDAPGWTRDGE